MGKLKCETCYFWEKDIADSAGQELDFSRCQRKCDAFPQRKADDWCGEHSELAFSKQVERIEFLESRFEKLMGIVDQLTEQVKRLIGMAK